MSKEYNERKENTPLINGNAFTPDQLNTIYHLGIARTLYKSNDLGKINQLRTALNLEDRTEAVPNNCYDHDTYEALCAIYNNNPIALMVLNFAGAGLTPDYNAQQDAEIDLAGAVE